MCFVHFDEWKNMTYIQKKVQMTKPSIMLMRCDYKEGKDEDWSWQQRECSEVRV